jgi:hypothetical protein
MALRASARQAPIRTPRQQGIWLAEPALIERAEKVKAGGVARRVLLCVINDE